MEIAMTILFISPSSGNHQALEAVNICGLYELAWSLHFYLINQELAYTKSLLYPLQL